MYIVYKLCRGDKPEWERGLTFLRKPPGHNIRVHTQYAVNVVLENLEATLLNQNRKIHPLPMLPAMRSMVSKVCRALKCQMSVGEI